MCLTLTEFTISPRVTCEGYDTLDSQAHAENFSDEGDEADMIRKRLRDRATPSEKDQFFVAHLTSDECDSLNAHAKCCPADVLV